MAQVTSSKSCASKLSKNTLQMKFMQRSVLRIEQQLNEDESRQIVDDEHWVLDLPSAPVKKNKYAKEPLFAVCDHLQYGRMSFKGFNPDVEKLMQIHNSEAELKISEEKEKETSVGDDEMASRYSSLIGVIAKKMSKKRQRPQTPTDESGGKKERSFMKPDY